jgi:hypothetical protein
VAKERKKRLQQEAAEAAAENAVLERLMVRAYLGNMKAHRAQGDANHEIYSNTHTLEEDIHSSASRRAFLQGVN